MLCTTLSLQATVDAPPPEVALPLQVLAEAAKPMKVSGVETEDRIALRLVVPPVRIATADIV